MQSHNSNNFVELFNTVHLTAIDPENHGSPVGNRFNVQDKDKIDHWVSSWNNKGRNIYFTVNDVKDNINKPKPNKQDITHIRALWADLDPDKTKDREQERLRLKSEILKLELEPTAIVDSGNGFALFWLLANPIEVNKDVLQRAETLGAKIAIKLGADKTQNVDRLMRWPDTTNYPNKVKNEAGYTACLSQLEHMSGKKYGLEQIEEFVQDINIDPVELYPERAIVRDKIKRTGEMPAKLQELLKNDDAVKSIWEGNPTSKQEDVSRSGFDMTLLAMLKARGLSAEDTLNSLMLFDYGKMNEMNDSYFHRMWETSKASPPTNNNNGGNGGGRGQNIKDFDHWAYVGELDRYFDYMTGGFYSSVSFNNLYKMQYQGGRGQPANASTAFLTDPYSFITRDCTWEPSKPKIIDRGPYKTLNLWSEPTMQATNGDVGRWLDHLKYLIPEDDHREHFIKWMAHNVQHPEIKINHQVLFAGNARIGKDTAIKPLFRYFNSAKSISTITQMELQSAFTDWADRKKFIVAEEIMSFEKRDIENKLKSLCASPPDTILINPKGMKPYEIPNLLSMVLFSNHKDAISIQTEGDTRYLCLWSDCKPKHVSYYNELNNWMNSGGDTDVIGFLKDLDISDFVARSGAPDTEYRKELHWYSKSGKVQELMEAVAEHRAPFHKDIVSSFEVKEFLNDTKASLTKIGLWIREIGGHKRSCVVKEDSKSRKYNLWCIRDCDSWQEKADKDWVEHFAKSI